MFLPGVSELETVENVKKQVLALLMTSNVAADLRSLYNGQPMASIKPRTSTHCIAAEGSSSNNHQIAANCAP